MTNDSKNTAVPLGVSATEVGRLLGVSTRKAYLLMTSGRLPAFRIGRRIIAIRSAVDDFIAKNLIRAGGENQE